MMVNHTKSVKLRKKMENKINTSNYFVVYYVR